MATTMSMTPQPQHPRPHLAGQYVATRQTTARLTTAVTLAAATLDFPGAQINVLDTQYQHTIGDPHSSEPCSIPRSDSICRFVVDSGKPLAVGDTRADSRFAGLPAVAAGTVGSYLGLPLVTPHTAGTLCVLDAQPRTITPGDVIRLGHFVDIVSGHLDGMRARTAQDRDQLAAAIANGEIGAHYEPIVDLRTGAVAYEAKARWVQASGAIVDPVGLLPAAGDVELVLELERAVLRRALADAARARRTAPDLRISVNISNRHLDTPDGVREICYAVMDAGLPPSAVDLELTETEDFVDEQAARNAVGALRQYGFGVVLDDFGSGWSSLEWVLRLPVSGIKVNRAAAAALGTPIGNTLARTLVALTTRFSLSAGIDGIVAPEQADVVRSLGYRHAQGSLWAPAGSELVG